jgi:hypothetical protein
LKIASNVVGLLHARDSPDRRSTKDALVRARTPRSKTRARTQRARARLRIADAPPSCEKPVPGERKKSPARSETPGIAPRAGRARGTEPSGDRRARDESRAPSRHVPFCLRKRCGGSVRAEDARWSVLRGKCIASHGAIFSSSYAWTVCEKKTPGHFEKSSAAQNALIGQRPLAGGN